MPLLTLANGLVDAPTPRCPPAGISGRVGPPGGCEGAAELQPDRAGAVDSADTVARQSSLEA